MNMKKTERYPSNTWNKECPEITDGKEVVLTITHVEMEPPQEGEPPKPTVYFQESDKRWIVGPTVWELIADIVGESDDDNWSGKQIGLFVDQSVRYGQIKGGVRPKNPNAVTDNIPF
jgi:hypothetical protein